MNITRRALALSGVGAAWGAWAPRLHARPRGGPLTLLVAQPAGGITDAFARAIAPALGHELARLAVVDNLPGASGTLAARRLLAAPPDGSTLFVGSSSETLLAPLTLRAASYQASDFRLLGLVNDSPLALYARGDLPANNLGELVALARRSGGTPLSYGSPGQGSLFHLLTQTLLSATGVQALHVPYRGGMPMLTDLQGGSIDFALLPVDALLGRVVAGGRIKVLGVSSAQRLARFPAAATFAESRLAPALGLQRIWVGLLAPAAMSEGVSVQLHQAVTRALSHVEVGKAINAAGGAVPVPLSLADAARFYAADAAQLRALAKAAHFERM